MLNELGDCLEENVGPNVRAYWLLSMQKTMRYQVRLVPHTIGIFSIRSERLSFPTHGTMIFALNVGTEFISSSHARKPKIIWVDKREGERAQDTTGSRKLGVEGHLTPD